MSETNDPFAAFKEGQPTEGAPGTAEAPAKNKKTARKKAGSKKGSANGNVDVVPSVSGSDGVTAGKTRGRSTGKKARKPRQKRELKLPLSTLVALGTLSTEESAVVQSITIGLADFSKKARSRVVAALAKIFA